MAAASSSASASSASASASASDPCAKAEETGTEFPLTLAGNTVDMMLIRVLTRSSLISIMIARIQFKIKVKINSII